MTNRSKISLIVTTLNEAKTIEALLAAVHSQTKRPDEVVIVDGGSTDDTVKKIKAFHKKLRGTKKKPKLKIRVFEEKGNRSIGRNFAVQKSKYGWIAITDAGCIPKENWLEMLVEKQMQSKATVVAGYYEGNPQTHLEEAIVPYALVMPDRVNEADFLPATRSMLISKPVFKKLGSFDETLSDNEDYAFALKIKESDETIAFARWAIVQWFPPKTLKSFARMIYRFARGDVFAGIVRPKVVLIFARYIFFILYTLFVFSGYFVDRSSGWQQFWFGLWLVLVAIYISWSIDKNHRYAPRGWIWLPILQVVADVMVMAGSCVGFYYHKKEKKKILLEKNTEV